MEAYTSTLGLLTHLSVCILILYPIWRFPCIPGMLIKKHFRTFCIFFSFVRRRREPISVPKKMGANKKNQDNNESPSPPGGVITTRHVWSTNICCKKCDVIIHVIVNCLITNIDNLGQKHLCYRVFNKKTNFYFNSYKYNWFWSWTVCPTEHLQRQKYT